MPECEICNDTGVVTGMATGYCRCRFGESLRKNDYGSDPNLSMEEYKKLMGGDLKGVYQIFSINDEFTITVPSGRKMWCNGILLPPGQYRFKLSFVKDQLKKHALEFANHIIWEEYGWYLGDKTMDDFYNEFFKKPKKP